MATHYSPEQLEAAVSAVEDGFMSRNAASKHFGVPRTTILDRLSGRVARVPKERTVLTTEEEAKISEWVMNMAKAGFSVTKSELLETVKRFLDMSERATTFKDNRPGKDWYYSFLQRHPEIRHCKPSMLGEDRALVSPHEVSEWFDDFEAYIESIDSFLLKEPARIYNCDETGFPLSAACGNVLGPSANTHRHLYYKITNSSKKQITSMMACSAIGHYIPPMVVLPGHRVTYNPVEDIQGGTVAVSLNGWMTADLFCQWLQKSFLPSIEKEKVRKPVVLLLDQSATYKSLEASKICADAGVILYQLPPNATHVIQPLNLCFFASLKENWTEEIQHFQMQHPGEVVTKKAFGRIFCKIFNQSATRDMAMSSFRQSGIFPFDKEKALSSDKLKASALLTHIPHDIQTHTQRLKEEPSPSTQSPPPSRSTIPPTPLPSTSTFPPPPPTSLPVLLFENHSNPSTPESGEPLVTPTAPSRPTTAATTLSDITPHMKLMVLESFMSPETLEKFQRRLEEGYDQPGDEFYEAWRSCRRLSLTATVSSTRAQAEQTEPLPFSSAKLHQEPMEAIFSVPAIELPARKRKIDSLPLLTSEECRIILEEERKEIEDQESKVQKRRKKESSKRTKGDGERNERAEEKEEKLEREKEEWERKKKEREEQKRQMEDILEEKERKIIEDQESKLRKRAERVERKKARQERKEMAKEMREQKRKEREERLKLELEERE